MGAMWCLQPGRNLLALIPHPHGAHPSQHTNGTRLRSWAPASSPLCSASATSSTTHTPRSNPKPNPNPNPNPPAQLGSCLPTIVPRISDVLNDPHPKVQAAANEALREVGALV